jgi:hypothetical protein
LCLACLFNIMIYFKMRNYFLSLKCLFSFFFRGSRWKSLLLNPC